MQSPTHRSGATLGQPSSAQSTGVATWLPLDLICPRLPLAMVTDAPGCKATALVLSTTYACDTVNRPEFPVMYLFWVLILCTEMAAHGCFFRGGKRTQWEKKTLHSMHFLVLCYACMCLAEGTRPISFGDLRLSGPATPAENPALSFHRHHPAPLLSVLDGAPRREGHQVPTGSQGISGSHPPMPSSCSPLRFVGRALDIYPWWRPTNGLGVAHHPTDSSVCQPMFPTTPASQVTWAQK